MAPFAISRPATSPPILIAGCAGRVPDERKKARAPSLVITGDHWMPVPVVRGAGTPPATGTAQRCRRSMSLAFEL